VPGSSEIFKYFNFLFPRKLIEKVLPGIERIKHAEGYLLNPSPYPHFSFGNSYLTYRRDYTTLVSIQRVGVL